MNKTCPHCGAPLPEEAAFCPVCAKSVNQRTEPTPPRRTARHLVWGCVAVVLIAAVLVGVWAWQRSSDSALTRADMAVLLAEALDYSAQDPDALLAAFSDTADLPDKQRSAIAAMIDTEIMNTTTDTTFSPNETLNRGQAAMLLWRCLGEPEPTRKELPFSDVHGEEEWYWAPVSALYKAGVFTADDAAGPNGEFLPEDPITGPVFEDWLGRHDLIQPVSSYHPPRGDQSWPGAEGESVDRFFIRPEMVELIAWKLQQDGQPEFASYDVKNLTDAQREAILDVTAETMTFTTFGGVPDKDIFDNNVPLTRAQAAVLLWWLVDCPEAPADAGRPFSDVVRGGPHSEWGDWPYDVSIAALWGEGILTLENAAVDGDAFDPAEDMLQADMDAWLAAAGIDVNG